MFPTRRIEAGDYITAQQALEILPVGKTLFYQLVKEGQIRSLRPKSVSSKRGKIVIPRAALEEYIEREEANERAARPGPAVDVDELLDRVRTSRRTKPGVESRPES